MNNRWPELRQIDSSGRTASFRGVSFHVSQVGDDRSRDVAVYVAPNRDGAEAEDMGRVPHRVSMTAVFWGDYYPDLIKLQEACDEGKPGLLSHPTFGEFQALVETNKITQKVPEQRYAAVELVFVRHEPDETGGRLLFGVSASGRADKAAEAVDKAQESAGQAVADQIAPALAGWVPGDLPAPLAALDQAADWLQAGEIVSDLTEAARLFEEYTGQAFDLADKFLEGVDMGLAWCNYVESAVLDRVRAVMSLPGRLAAQAQFYLAEAAALQADLERVLNQPLNLVAHFRASVAQALTLAAGDVVQVALALEDANDFVAENLDLTAQPAEEDLWA